MNEPLDRLPNPSTLRSAVGKRSAVGSWIAGGVILLGLCGLLLWPLHFDYHPLWVDRGLDFSHIPLFLILVASLRLFVGLSLRNACVSGIVLATLFEIVQPAVGRSGGWLDLVYGLCGSMIATVGLCRSWRWSSKLAAIGLLFAPAAWNDFPTFIDAWLAWRQFPMIAQFDTPFARSRWVIQAMEFSRVMDSGQFQTTDQADGRAAVHPVVVDWSAYKEVVVDFTIVDEPLDLLIAIRDSVAYPPEVSRYNHPRRKFEPGRHEVVIPFTDLTTSTRFPPLDMHKIQNVILVPRQRGKRIFQVHSIYLR